MVSYQQPATTGRLQRVGGLATAATVLIGVVGAASLVTALVQGTIRDDARAYLAGDITEDDFIAAFGPSAGIGLLSSAAQIGAVVITMILLFRLAANLRAIGRNTTWAPGWAIGGWFVPPFVLYVVPYLMLRELWKASDPAIPQGDDRWRQGSVPIGLTIWWVLFGLLPIALLVVQGVGAVGGVATGGTEAVAESIVDRYAVTLIGGVVSFAAAIAFIVTMRALVTRHRTLIGDGPRA